MENIKFSDPGMAIKLLESRGYEIINGVIVLKKDERSDEKLAIDYLCDKWDFSALTL